MDATQVKALVDNVGYPTMFESYEKQAIVYPMIADVQPIDPRYMYGEKGRVVGGLGEFRQREDNEPPQEDDLFTGPEWWLQLRIFSRSLRLPERLLMASDAQGQVESLIAAATRLWGEQAALTKDDFVAGMFQKGTLTAGNVDYFDNSINGTPDPHAGFVYDGLPWFDTAHTITGGTATFSNISTGGSLTSSNLETYLNTMQVTNAKSERNRRISVRPNVLLVPNNVELYKAKRILQSASAPGSANNDINALQGELTPILWPALNDDTDCGYIGQAGKGILVRDSGAPTIKIVPDLVKGGVMLVAEMFYGATVTDAFRYWYSYGRADS